MSLDGKLLARARAALDEKKRVRDALYDRRLAAVYAKAPRVREIDREIRAEVSRVIEAALESNGDGADIAEEALSRGRALRKTRKSEILRAGFPEDYLSDDYMCKYCRDTGYIGTEICSCLMRLYKIEQKADLSNLLKLGTETFETFNLSYYDDTPNPESGVSPRRNMKIIFETCCEYARKFGKKSSNLFFIGAPGLGKTFLSACIARVVAENGFSVVYDTAGSVFSKFEDDKFARTQEQDAARDEVRRCLECDLLILDDLGTEMVTAFTISALYELINSRLINGKKTIISSNLTVDELHNKYSDQINSRLMGEYQVLMFYGDDIRRLKKLLP